MRFVELSPEADSQRTALPLRTRREIDRAIRAIAARPAWGASPSRFLAPDSENTGLIADLSVREYAIVYRIRSADDVIWIEYIGPVFLG